MISVQRACAKDFVNNELFMKQHFMEVQDD
jgi:hypothetical protein